MKRSRSMQSMRLITLVALVGACVTARSSASPTVAPDALRVRKDVKSLTATERADYVNAVLRLKSTPSPFDPSLSYYDQFVAWHVRLSRCESTDPLMQHMQMGHVGPMFLPWHRQFVLLFENALREVSGKDITVPYWDWTEPDSTRAVFSDDLMGGDGDPADGYAVKTGPFRKGNWTLNVQPIGLQWSGSATPYLTRHLGGWPMTPLPSASDVGAALRAPLYDAPPYDSTSDTKVSFRNALEGFKPPLSALLLCGPDGAALETPAPFALHNAVHLWVGGSILPRGGGARWLGTMANVTTSPNDPVFFLHHSMIDRIWAHWQATHGVNSYLPTSGYEFNNADDTMTPFDEAGIVATPSGVADITALGYTYADLPSGPSPSRTLSQKAVAAAVVGVAPEMITDRFLCKLRALA